MSSQYFYSMASAADSGFETGNDSNDSTMQEKLLKMDLENPNPSLQKVSAECEHESPSGSEQSEEVLIKPHSSSEIVLMDRSLKHLHSSTLMHGYEYNPKLPSPEACFALNFRPYMPVHEFYGGSGGHFVTQPKGPTVGNVFIDRKSRIRSGENRFKCLRHTSVANYCRLKDAIRMCRAACHNNTEAMQQMLQSGMSPNVQDGCKRTPLHLAACMGYTDMVKLLLDHGADPNAKDSIGNTPLHLAACTNHVPVITLLLKAGTRISAGNSPLQLAITKFNIIKRSIMPHPVLKEQVAQVISMLTEYMRRKEGQSLDAELLNKFESLVRVSDSSEQVEDNIRDLLSNLSSLDISSSS